ncbi:vacuolar fusion protein CCZ1 homolog B-like isoform X1 [Cucurbita maxima]|uniref:Vacuolar fusion protein CCZ1 homolog B-like isoform X1 n=1 Tax=Cucurbita maxima TaxID=3661 RepID=A0A6J1JRG2_CUCMA|nr:vacuolar fusion protein CCZ1 homolog B-like isoform X1 [Cucurbita maxima]
MGLSTATTSVSEAIQLCVFDSRRGQQEGQELDKILFFYPADLPFTKQLYIIGLSEGLITFTRTFSPEAACEVIEAEKHSHVFFEAEQDIWMILVVEKNKELEAIWRMDALQKLLKEIHSLFLMFHGSIRLLLEKEPTGEASRSHLYSFITDYLNACQKRSALDRCCCDFLVGKKLQLPSFVDCLKERGTVQMLTIGRDAAIEVQALVRTLDSCIGNASCHSLILFQDLLVSTTLSPDDTTNLSSYAVLRLTPRVLSSGTSSWSYLIRGNAASHVAQHGGNVGNRVIRPLQHGKWSKGKDGFLETDIWGMGASGWVGSTPKICLFQTEEQMYLYVYQNKSLTLILLVPVSSVPNEELGIAIVRQHILENASLKIVKVEETLSKGWGGENAYHVGGYRYLLVDGDSQVSRASPPGKVTTLAKESLLAMSKLREKVDLEKSRAKQDSVDEEKELEVTIRAKNNAWAISRITRGKELYMVLEKANETLLYASDMVEKFSNRYCNGAFSLD